MTILEKLSKTLNTELGAMLTLVESTLGELTAVCLPSNIINTLQQLRHHPALLFNQLIDICGVDYLTYGLSHWETDTTSEAGFSRGVTLKPVEKNDSEKPRFAVVYHFLSTIHNHRLRLKVYLDEDNLRLPSACDIWKSANWFEREAYDFYGILFENHPDLRRILTDYGFIGHPFRKDFPVSGYVEMRYDKTLRKVIYEPVAIEPRVLVPKVIRKDNRYLEKTGANHD